MFAQAAWRGAVRAEGLAVDDARLIQGIKDDLIRCVAIQNAKPRDLLVTTLRQMVEQDGGRAMFVGIDAVDVHLVVELDRVDDWRDLDQPFDPRVRQRLPQDDAVVAGRVDILR